MNMTTNAGRPKGSAGRWRVPRIALAILGVSTLMADGGLREDEIDCEEAVSYLQGCCPGFAQHETLQCEYTSGCGVTEPAISIEQSQCILAESCEQIVARGICERALNLPSPYSSSLGGGGSGGGSSSTTPSTVCP